MKLLKRRSWLTKNHWLICRRLVQLSILALFLLGPVADIWFVKGNLSSSLTLNLLPLSDPYVIIQSLAAGHAMAETALIGGLIVCVFYILVGGRAYCSWVCPVNVVTDLSHWLREKLKVRSNKLYLKSHFRYLILILTLVLAFITGSIVWEFINPISMLYRGLLFGIGSAWIIILSVFLLDLFVSRRAWCGYLCPVGAFYSLLGKISILRVATTGKAQCNNCLDCFKVCPEPRVINPALKGSEHDSSLILSANCTNCGRCIDVCDQRVFTFTTRFHSQSNQIHSIKWRKHHE